MFRQWRSLSANLFLIVGWESPVTESEIDLWILLAPGTCPNIHAIDWAIHAQTCFAKAQAPKENQTHGSPLSM